MDGNKVIRFMIFFLLCSLITTQTMLPQRVRVSGLPFLMHGWNNEFTLEHDGRYVMPKYMLYGVLPIVGAYLKHTSNPECDYNPSLASCKWGGSFHGRWHMFRYDGMVIAHKDSVGVLPTGTWKVEDKEMFTVSDVDSQLNF